MVAWRIPSLFNFSLFQPCYKLRLSTVNKEQRWRWRWMVCCTVFCTCGGVPQNILGFRARQSLNPSLVTWLWLTCCCMYHCSRHQQRSQDCHIPGRLHSTGQSLSVAASIRSVLVVSVSLTQHIIDKPVTVQFRFCVGNSCRLYVSNILHHFWYNSDSIPGSNSLYFISIHVRLDLLFSVSFLPRSFFSRLYWI